VPDQTPPSKAVSDHGLDIFVMSTVVAYGGERVNVLLQTVQSQISHLFSKVMSDQGLYYVSYKSYNRDFGMCDFIPLLIFLNFHNKRPMRAWALLACFVWSISQSCHRYLTTV